MTDAFQYDFGALARRAREMQTAVAEMQRDLETVEAKGYAGGGVVAATVSGQGHLVDLRIDSSVIEPDDPASLSALVIAAVNSALDELSVRRTAMMSGVTDGFAGMADAAQRSGRSVTPLRPNRPQ
jgi:DNA-binding YbaB/EbfC family protein